MEIHCRSIGTNGCFPTIETIEPDALVDYHWKPSSPTPFSPEPLTTQLSQNFTIDQVYFTQKSYLHKKEVRGALLPLCTVGKHKLPWRVTDQPHLPEILDPGDLKSVLERSGGLGVLQLIHLYNHKCHEKSTAKGEARRRLRNSWNSLSRGQSGCQASGQATLFLYNS